MTYTVFLADDAQQDLLAIHQYVSRHDSPENAKRLLALIEKSVAQLSSLPKRGHYPPELDRVGIRTYREIFCKPYRIIYDIAGNTFSYIAFSTAVGT
jgi:toxin ParE1/3/4